MRSETILSVEGLCKSFSRGPESIHVLNGVDLDVKRAEGIAVVGASGTGKSTMLHLIGGLDKPDDGIIIFEDSDICRMNQRDLAAFRNKEVGFIFQFHFLLPEFTALENVMIPALITGSKKTAAKKRALELLETVGLSHRIHHKPGALSGGEQQRVSVARALMMSPKILLADEPTGDLDPETGLQMQNLFTGLRSSLGITMITVTHNLDLAGSMDRVLELKGGHLEPRII